MDNVVEELCAQDQSIIDIHDAILLCPTQAPKARQLYADQLTQLHTNRNTILENYFNSIGITGASMQRWKDEVLTHVVPFEGTFNCNVMVLK